MHEYLARLLKALDLGLIDFHTLVLAKVFHDNNCSLDTKAGTGICDCDPQIIIATPQGDAEVLADGTLMPLPH